MKTALLTGLTGQDGTYMARLLLSKGYQVFGLVRRSSRDPWTRAPELKTKVKVVEGDLADFASIEAAVRESKPQEVYNLGAQSFVASSWTQAEATMNVTGIGVQRMLEAVIRHAPQARFYQASSSEMYGAAPAPQGPSTPFLPQSPYGAAKLMAHHLIRQYRDRGLYAVSGICFNHESPLRGLEFVSRKITTTVAAIKQGRESKLLLGNLNALRDWGFAGDYVEGMWLSLQRPQPRDYIFATGEAHSVKEFCRLAFDSVDLDWRKYVVSTPALVRQNEVPHLCGDSSETMKALKWAPVLSFSGLVGAMVRHDMMGGV